VSDAHIATVTHAVNIANNTRPVLLEQRAILDRATSTLRLFMRHLYDAELALSRVETATNQPPPPDDYHAVRNMNEIGAASLALLKALADIGGTKVAIDDL